MFTMSKFALVAAFVLGATFSASAATKARVGHNSQAAAYDTIPGYGKDGDRVSVPNPER